MPHTSQLRVVLFAFACLILVSGPKRVYGQGFPSSATNVDNPFPFLVRNKFYNMAKGDQGVKVDRDTLTNAARYYLYLGLVPQMQDQEAKGFRRRAITDRRRQFAREIKAMTDDRVLRKNGGFRRMFSEELVKALRKGFSKELLEFYTDGEKTAKQRYRSAKVYLGLNLPLVAKIVDTGTEQKDRPLGQLLVELASRKDDPIAQLFAFQAMETYFLKAKVTLSPNLKNAQRKAKTALLKPAYDLLTHPPENWKTMPKAELNAYRYIRCEAIKALGAGGIPAYPMLGNIQGSDYAGDIDFPVAYTLIRMLSKQDTKYPSLTFAERHAAVVALCRMRAREMPRYNPETAVKIVGKHIVELIKRYANDRAYLVAERDDKVRIPYRYPWKDMAKELREALVTFRQNLPFTSPALKKLNQVAAQANKTLESQVEDTFSRKSAVVEPPTALDTVLSRMKVSGEIYKDAPKYKVDAW